MANQKEDDGQIKGADEDREIDSIFSDQIPTTFPAPFSSIFDTPSRDHEEIKSSNLGFIDMLEIQDYTPSLFDMFQTPPPPPPPPLPPELASPSAGNSTNNSISSLSSTELVTTTNDAQSKTDQEEDKEEKSTSSTINNQLKPKKKNTKRIRQPRFAFMTKSDVDHLDDGYRWRKYGQKAVKNSPYPRSYYRCTMASCGVKKRVERSCEDSTIVVTTYEGTHAHQCPVTLIRTTTTTTAVLPEAPTAAFIAGAVHFPVPNSPNFLINSNNSQPGHNYNINNNINPPQPFSTNINPALVSDFVPHNYYNCPPPSSSSSSTSSMVRDHGLLQDMIMPRKNSEDHHHHHHDQHH